MIIIGYWRVIRSVYRTCKNWQRIIYAKVTGTSLPYIILTDGTRLCMHAPIPPAALSMFCEIFADEKYTQNGYSIPANATVFDVGANAGFFSIYAARVERSRVYAFEPIPRLVRMIECSRAENNFENLSIYPYALSDHNGNTVFFESHEHDGCHSLYQRNNHDDRISVETRTLQTFCEEHTIHRIDILKLDCEGAEYQILLTMDVPFLIRAVHCIVMEYHDDIVPGKTHTDIDQFLRAAGFEVIVADGFLYARNSSLSA